MRRRRSPTRAQSRQAKKPAASRANAATRPEPPTIPRPEDRLSFTASQIPTVMWSVDRDLRITSGMGSGANAMGLRENEHVGKTLFDIFQTTDTEFPPIRTHLRALEGESGSYEVEYRGRTLSAHVQPIEGGDGVITGAMGVGLDITERRRAEEALRTSEHRYRELVESAPVGIFRSTHDGRVLMANATLAGMLGYPSVDDLLALNLGRDIYLHEEDRTALVARHEAEATPWTVDIEWKRKDGAPIWVRITAHVVRGAGGEFIYFEAFVRDVTEHKRAEQELEAAEAARRASEEQYRVIAETATDVIVTIDEASHILFVNPAAQPVLGYRPDELVGQSLTVLMPESLRKRHSTGLSRYVVTGMRHMRWSGIELVARRKDGSEFPAEISFGETFRDGRRVFTGFIRDITARKRADDSLRDSRQRLRGLTGRLEQVREEERAHIAREIHDQLGQSLTAIKLDLAALSEHLPEGDAWRRARDTLALLDDTIKAVRRISAELRPVVLDELGLAAAVEWYAQDFAQRTGLEVRVNADALDGELHRDNATGLFRILQEALTNVARHAGARTVRVALHRRASTLSLEIIDDGTGITPEQAAAPTSLGLLGMRERAILLGGTMEIMGEPKGGTRVTVWIPVK